MTDWLLIALSVLLASSAQILQKRGMARTLASVRSPLLRPLLQPLVLTGIGCQAVLTVVWLVVLSRVHVSLAFPCLSLGYVVVLAYSRMVLGERVPSTRWLGVALIVIGVAVLGYGETV